MPKKKQKTLPEVFVVMALTWRPTHHPPTETHRGVAGRRQDTSQHTPLPGGGGPSSLVGRIPCRSSSFSFSPASSFHCLSVRGWDLYENTPNPHSENSHTTAKRNGTERPWSPRHDPVRSGDWDVGARRCESWTPVRKERTSRHQCVVVPRDGR